MKLCSLQEQHTTVAMLTPSVGEQLIHSIGYYVNAILVKLIDKNAGVKTLETANLKSLYPNPTDSEIKIALDENNVLITLQLFE